VDGVPHQVHDQDGPVPPHAGEVLAHEAVEAGVLETDRVEHARGSLGDPREGVPLPGLERDALSDDGSIDARIEEPLHLLPVTERAGGGNEGILEEEGTYSHLERRGPFLDRNVHCGGDYSIEAG